jgi:RND family efflux transporter MFP subunit
VQAVRVTPADWPDLYEAPGAVRAGSSAALSSRVSANVQNVAVAVGERVRAGQTLVTLDLRDLEPGVPRTEADRSATPAANPDAERTIASAKSNLDRMQADLARKNECNTGKPVRTAECDEAAARLKEAQSVYDDAVARRGQLDSKPAQPQPNIRPDTAARDSRIVAPFAGIVTARSVEPGTVAAPGAPLVTIERAGGFHLEVPVEEAHAPSIRPGQDVAVSIDALGKSINGRVSEVGPIVDAVSGGRIVKLDLPPLPNLRPGMVGRASFRLTARKVLTIPDAALVDRGQSQQVFAVHEGHARLRAATIGRRVSGRVEILTGLSEGDQVIAPVPAGLSDGARVEVRP